VLTFLVQGSAREPYKLTAQGSGADLQIFCTCPASRKGGKFCKHAAALLMGDMTRLVHGHGDVIELQSRARSSPLLERALQHIPGKEGPPPELSSFKPLAEVRDRHGEQLAARGWHASNERAVEQAADRRTPRRPSFRRLDERSRVDNGTSMVKEMRKSRKIIGFSLAPAMATAVKAEADRRGVTLRKLFEEMWQLYLANKLGKQ